jgi:hypothetical protein
MNVKFRLKISPIHAFKFCIKCYLKVNLKHGEFVMLCATKLKIPLKK